MVWPVGCLLNFAYSCLSPKTPVLAAVSSALQRLPHLCKLNPEARVLSGASSGMKRLSRLRLAQLMNACLT
jgi:hypothetical protein